jgi:hypothetical protein
VTIVGQNAELNVPTLYNAKHHMAGGFNKTLQTSRSFQVTHDILHSFLKFRTTFNSQLQARFTNILSDLVPLIYFIQSSYKDDAHPKQFFDF